MAYMFPGNMCPSGKNKIPVTMSLPDNLPQSFDYEDSNFLFYRFKVQVVPVHTSDVTDKNGNCSL